MKDFTGTVSSRLARTLGILLATTAATPVLAQTAAPDSAEASPTNSHDNSSVGEIVVTAQKREQRLTDVPLSIAAVSGETLSARGVTNTDNLSLVTPSIQVNKFIAPYQATIRIRGVGTNVSAPTIEPSVSMVVDGVVISRQGSFFTDLADIERVEVIRGPQSTLFGKNAIAGAINVITRRPNLNSVDGSVDASVNSYGDITLRGTVSGPLAPNLGIRLTGAYFNEGDGVIKNINPNGPRLDNAQSIGGRAKIYWEPTSSVKVMLIGDYRHSKGPNGVRTATNFESPAVQNLYGVGPVDFNNRRVNINGGPVGRNDYDNADWGLSGQIEVKLGDNTLTSITAYRDWSLDSYLDIDGIATITAPSGYDDIVIVPGVGSVATGRFPLIGNSEVFNFIRSHQFSQELRLTSPGDKRLRYVLGMFYWNTKVDFDNNQYINICPVNSNVLPVNVFDGDPGALTGTCRIPALGGVKVANRNDNIVSTNYIAGFGQFDFDLVDRLTLTGGARLQRETFDYTVSGLAPNTFSAAYANAQNIFSGSKSVGRTILTGKASLSYKPSEESNIYISYARGYKGPGLDAPGNLTALPASPLEAETSNAYEVGFKSQFLDRHASLNVALFWQEISNLQQSAFDPATATLKAINAGASRQRGIEAELNIRPSRLLDFSASLVYLDAIYTKFNNADCYAPRSLDTYCSYTLVPGGAAIGVANLSGQRVPYSPKLSANIGVGFKVPFTDAGDAITLRADYRYVSEQYNSLNPGQTIPSYGLLNLQIGAAPADSGLSATFFVNNVFNKSYSTLRSSYSYSGFPTAAGVTTTDIFAKDSRRTYGMSVRYQF